jgi:hypothetical protein
MKLSPLGRSGMHCDATVSSPGVPAVAAAAGSGSAARTGTGAGMVPPPGCPLSSPNPSSVLLAQHLSSS